MLEVLSYGFLIPTRHINSWICLRKYTRALVWHYSSIVCDLFHWNYISCATDNTVPKTYICLLNISRMDSSDIHEYIIISSDCYIEFISRKSPAITHVWRWGIDKWSIWIYFPFFEYIGNSISSWAMHRKNGSREIFCFLVRLRAS